MSKFKDQLLIQRFKREQAQLVRNRKTFNLNNAKTIGLLFFIENNNKYKHALETIKSFQEKNLKVQALGFINEKNYPAYFHPMIYFNIFTLKDINWYGKPKTNTVQNFIKMDYDILIDMSAGDHFILKYIAGLSAARFKVGRFGDENDKYYDLMIMMDKNLRFDDYINQVIHYLNLINN